VLLIVYLTRRSARICRPIDMRSLSFLWRDRSLIGFGVGVVIASTVLSFIFGFTRDSVIAILLGAIVVIVGLLTAAKRGPKQRKYQPGR